MLKKYSFILFGLIVGQQLFCQKELSITYYDTIARKFRVYQIDKDSLEPDGVYFDKPGNKTIRYDSSTRKYLVDVLPAISYGMYYNKEFQKVRFDTILLFSTVSKKELYNASSKFFNLGNTQKVSGIVNENVLYTDSDEIVVSGIYRTYYRPHGNTHDFNCVYRLTTKFKDGKIKCTFSDFVLYPTEVKTSTFGWFNASGFGISSSTSQIGVESRPVEPIFLKKHTSKHYKLFPLMQEQVLKVLSDLSIAIKEHRSKDDW